MSLACLIIPGCKVIEYKLNEKTNTFVRLTYYSDNQIICDNRRSVIYNDNLLKAFNDYYKKTYTAAEYLHNLSLPSTINIDEIVNKSLVFYKNSFYIVDAECLIGLYK